VTGSGGGDTSKANWWHWEGVGGDAGVTPSHLAASSQRSQVPLLRDSDGSVVSGEPAA